MRQRERRLGQEIGDLEHVRCVGPQLELDVHAGRVRLLGCALGLTGYLIMAQVPDRGAALVEAVVGEGNYVAQYLTQAEVDAILGR